MFVGCLMTNASILVFKTRGVRSFQVKAFEAVTASSLLHLKFLISYFTFPAGAVSGLTFKVSGQGRLVLDDGSDYKAWMFTFTPKERPGSSNSIFTFTFKIPHSIFHIPQEAYIIIFTTISFNRDASSILVALIPMLRRLYWCNRSSIFSTPSYP